MECACLALQLMTLPIYAKFCATGGLRLKQIEESLHLICAFIITGLQAYLEASQYDTVSTDAELERDVCSHVIGETHVGKKLLFQHS